MTQPLILQPELLAIECSGVPKKITQFTVEKEVYNEINIKAAYTILSIIHIPDEPTNNHTAKLEFSCGKVKLYRTKESKYVHSAAYILRVT